MNERYMGLAASLLLAAGVSMQAGAAEAPRAVNGEVTTSVLVRYSPNALATDGGVQALYEKLQAAARRACGDYDIKRAAERQRRDKCYDGALAGALAQVGDRRLAALD